MTKSNTRKIACVDRDIFIFIYLQNDHLDILGFHINDFDADAVNGIGDTRVVCVSSIVFRSSGNEIDRVGNSFELLSPPDDDG
jgi:hypothetical protein